MKYILLLSLLILFCSLQAQYDPDAGRIPSYTEGAKVIISSGNNIAFVTDNNHHTFWESEHALPDGYIGRSYLNAFHSGNPDRLISEKGPAFDGNLNTMQQFEIKKINNKYRLEIKFSSPSQIKLLSIKAQLTAPLRITLSTKKASVFAGNVRVEDNYSLQNIRVSESYAFESVILESDAPFGLFELAGLRSQPYEFVAFDFGSLKDIQQIWSRHMSGNNVEKGFIELSSDGLKWITVAEINPQAVPFLPTVLDKSYRARFLRIRYDLSMEDYGKALLWEVKVFDKNGPFGPPPAFQSNHKKLAERIGINGIWGWGYNTYSDNLPQESGSELFKSVASKARNYHELLWDITEPGRHADYAKMIRGEGTQASWWLNWDREYSFWKAKGLSPTATIQFKNETIPESAWTKPFDQAYQYGFDFASHFGSEKGNGLLHLVEISNEPWDYSKGFYPVILNGMLKGMKDADKAMNVVPAAFQATFRQFEGHDYNNYLGDNIDSTATKLLDGLNGHFYSHIYNADGKRIGTHPEDPASEFHSSRNLLRFRDKNMAGKPVFVTEYGYDSQGGGEDCLHEECVTEAQQAAWGLRAALLLLRNGIDEVYWYFFANEFTASFLHTRSGLTGSLNTGFQKKQSFIVFEKLLEQLGESKMTAIINENEDYYCYLFEDASGQQTAIAWRPIGGDPKKINPLKVRFPQSASAFLVLNGGKSTDWETIHPSRSPELPLSGFPMLIRLESE
ncbi:MAG: discoidin domain-containing protein [Bacteroidales bacterium]|nr:discoidin domain-containing protein [Bacteroidales bacterium]